MKEKPIAFFDSGIGGLTVFKQLKELLPNENYIYFGDLKNIPYGEKSKEELVNFSKIILDFFEEKNIKAAVMACNSTSANAYEEVKNDYDFNIYPIIQTCAKEIASLPIKNIGVFATEATIKSNAYKNELKKYNPSLEIIEIACPEWVNIVEKKKQNEAESINLVKKYLDEMQKNKPDKIILGCTHYPYLMEILKTFAKEDLFIDPAQIFAQSIKKDLEEKSLLSFGCKGSEEFFVSKNPEQFKDSASVFYDLKTLPKLV